MSKLFGDIIEQERAAGEAKGIAKAEAKAQREKEGFVSNVIKAGTMTLDKIAEAFNMTLAQVQVLAEKQGLS